MEFYGLIFIFAAVTGAFRRKREKKGKGQEEKGGGKAREGAGKEGGGF